LIESELFGHCRGAFTHALTDRPGSIRKADGGTLFLDEIGDMPLELQSRFLRTLQEKKVRPVGSDEEKSVNFRLVCATHRDLAKRVAQGSFREDLYYRLQVLEVRLPPLRERRVDIPFLLRRFLGELTTPEVAESALAELPKALLQYGFPGNVRELRNFAERYVALRELGYGWDKILAARESDRIASAVGGQDGGAVIRRNSHLTEEEIILALNLCGHHRGKTAEKLGVTRRALQYRLEKMRARERAAESFPRASDA
jgi:two-component system response regulator PilR (NtrC family)